MLKSNIEKGSVLNTYFIFGNDAYLKKLYVDKIISRTVDISDDFNFQKFSAGCDLQDVYDAKEQFPMMAQRKCVLLTDYDFEAANKADFEKLEELLSNPCETTVFIFWCNALIGDEKKGDRLKKLIAATELGGGMAARIDHRTKADLVRLLQEGAKKRGTSFEMGVAAYLIENCSEDINVLLCELEKLCAFSNNKPITKATVDLICVKSVDASVYNLTNEIFSQNTARALKLLGELYDMRIEPMIILHTISANFVDMFRVLSAVDSGVQLADLAADFSYGNKKFVLEKCKWNLNRVNAEKLKLCFDEILSADAALKSFSAQDRIVLEELIIKLIYIIAKGEKIDKAPKGSNSGRQI